MSFKWLFNQLALTGVACVMVSCSDVMRPPAISFKIADTPVVPRSIPQMGSEVRVKQDFMSKSSRPRRKASSMSPKFITIHSTANRSADALQHARALKNGALGSLNWHFTADENLAVQHIPLNETGRHADKGGPGDRFSIGIEMCEVRGQNCPRVYARAAKLTAILMKRYNIPLRNVVPHYYWTGKNCPAPLLTNGRPGYKWSWFISRVDYYRRCLDAKPAPVAVNNSRPAGTPSRIGPPPMGSL